MTDLAAFLAAVDSTPGLSMHSLLITKDGDTTDEAYWAPYQAADRALVYSCSKSVTGLAVGIAIGEGLLRLDSLIVDLVPGSVPDPLDDRVAATTLHHLLSMSTGHDVDTMPLIVTGEPDRARLYLSIRPAAEVGSRHVYNNGASWLLADIVRRAAGSSLMDYLTPRLFEPLGIHPTWEVDAFGRELGLSGVHITTRDLAALGELYRRQGEWDGNRLVPADYMAAATRKQIGTFDPASPDWSHGYGYQVWIGREGYRLDGAYGQFSLVLPERGTVITMTSVNPQGGQPLLRAVWDHLLPALERTPDPAPAAVAGLAVPHPRDAGSGGPWRAAGPLQAVASLAPGTDQVWVPELSGVDLERTDAGWRLAFSNGGAAVCLDVPEGPGWSREVLSLDGAEVPVGISIGTLSNGDARVWLCFVDTPHVLRIELGRRRGVAWETCPLGDPVPLATLHA